MLPELQGISEQITGGTVRTQPVTRFIGFCPHVPHFQALKSTDLSHSVSLQPSFHQVDLSW